MFMTVYLLYYLVTYDYFTPCEQQAGCLSAHRSSCSLGLRTVALHHPQNLPGTQTQPDLTLNQQMSKPPLLLSHPSLCL